MNKIGSLFLFLLLLGVLAACSHAPGSQRNHNINTNDPPGPVPPSCAGLPTSSAPTEIAASDRALSSEPGGFRVYDTVRVGDQIAVLTGVHTGTRDDAYVYILDETGSHVRSIWLNNPVFSFDVDDSKGQIHSDNGRLYALLQDANGVAGFDFSPQSDSTQGFEVDWSNFLDLSGSADVASSAAGTFGMAWRTPNSNAGRDYYGVYLYGLSQGADNRTIQLQATRRIVYGIRMLPGTAEPWLVWFEWRHELDCSSSPTCLVDLVAMPARADGIDQLSTLLTIETGTSSFPSLYASWFIDADGAFLTRLGPTSSAARLVHRIDTNGGDITLRDLGEIVPASGALDALAIVETGGEHHAIFTPDASRECAAWWGADPMCEPYLDHTWWSVPLADTSAPPIEIGRLARAGDFWVGTNQALLNVYIDVDVIDNGSGDEFGKTAVTVTNLTCPAP